MKNHQEYSFDLVPEQIDKTVQTLIEILKELNVEKKQLLSIRLSVEDNLVNWMEEKSFQKCTMTVSKFLGLWKIVFEAQEKNSEQLITFTNESGSFDYAEKLCSALNENGLKIEFSKKKDTHFICYTLAKRQINPLLLNLFAILMAVAFSILIKHIPHGVQSVLIEKIIIPTYETYLSLLTSISVFMIFFSILSCITNMGDLSSFGRYGRKTAGSFIKELCISAVVLTIPVMLCTGTLGNGSLGGAGILGDFYITILNIIPPDLISPFINKNTLQITFIAVAAGIFILMLENKCRPIIDGINSLNLVVMKSIEALCHLMPLCIFFAVSSLILQDGLATILKTWKIFLFLFVFGGINALRIILVCALKLKINFFQLVKDAFPSGFVGFVTSSSFACIENLRELAVKKYGVSEKNFSFVFSMNQIFNKISMLACCIIEFFVIASIYNINFSLSHILIISAINILIAISTPSVPGGGIAAWASLITIGGLPQESLTIVISATFLEDMIDTGLNVFCCGPQIIYIDRKLKEL